VDAMRRKQMSNEEEFVLIANKIKNEEILTAEEAKKIIEIIYGLDTNLVILQSTLEFSVGTLQETLIGVSNEVLKMAGRTDKKIKTKVAKYAAAVTASYENSLQMYLTELSMRAEEYLRQQANGEIPTEQTTEKEGNNE
jgi:hypothetical protein